MSNEKNANENAGHKPGHQDPQPNHGNDPSSNKGNNGHHGGRDRLPGKSHSLVK